VLFVFTSVCILQVRVRCACVYIKVKQKKVENDVRKKIKLLVNMCFFNLHIRETKKKTQEFLLSGLII
jgi:hypothetical protein